MTPPAEILALRDHLKAWLLERAFPIWCGMPGQT